MRLPGLCESWRLQQVQRFAEKQFTRGFGWLFACAGVMTKAVIRVGVGLSMVYCLRGVWVCITYTWREQGSGKPGSGRPVKHCQLTRGAPSLWWDCVHLHARWCAGNPFSQHTSKVLDVAGLVCRRC